MIAKKGRLVFFSNPYNTFCTLQIAQHPNSAYDLNRHQSRIHTPYLHHRFWCNCAKVVIRSKYKWPRKFEFVPIVSYLNTRRASVIQTRLSKATPPDFCTVSDCILNMPTYYSTRHDLKAVLCIPVGYFSFVPFLIVRASLQHHKSVFPFVNPSLGLLKQIFEQCQSCFYSWS